MNSRGSPNDSSEVGYSNKGPRSNPDDLVARRLVMAFVFNITFDARDPQALARFWSQATGYEITDESADFVRLRAPDSRGVRHILFFRVDDPTPGKNRVHIDLASKDPDEEITRLMALGAHLVDTPVDEEPVWREGGGTKWVVMTDPEGNVFCIG